MIDANAMLYIFSFILSFSLTAVIARALIPMLKKNAEQPIYEEGPSWHSAKAGTPTMGGLAFLISVTITLSLAAVYLIYRADPTEAASLFSCLLFAVLNGIVGIADDCKKLRHRQNRGLTALQKLILQACISIAFLAYRCFAIGDDCSIVFSLGRFDVGPWYYLLAFVMLIGVTNCANLTDGVDGLASGVAFAVGAALFFICCALNTQISVIAAAIMGATIAFLIFNLHPARVFMGDTGSLFLGAMIASSGLLLENPFMLAAICAVYVIEGASVVLQVAWYKATHRRLFKMAPLHHHLEKIGWSENRICIAAIILTMLFALPVYIFYLP